MRVYFCSQKPDPNLKEISTVFLKTSISAKLHNKQIRINRNYNHPSEAEIVETVET